MFISDLVNQFSQNQTIQNKAPQGSKEAKSVSNPTRSDAALARFSAGTTFEGNISDIKGDKVTLALENGKTLTARLAGDVALVKGESVFFEVKSNDGLLINIKPVSIGLMSNPTILAALNMAGLPVNEKNVSMVDSMMKEQLPIDAASLSDMTKTVASHPNADVNTLVTMQKAGIPITDEMVQQFNNYKVSEGGITEAITDIADAITETFASEDVSQNDIIVFQENLTAILTTEEGVVPHIFDSEGNVIMQPDGAETIPVEVSENGEILTAEAVNDMPVSEDLLTEDRESAGANETNVQNTANMADEADIKSTLNESVAEQEIKNVDIKALAGEETAINNPQESAAASPAEEKTAQILNPTQAKELGQLMKDLGIDTSEIFDSKGNIKENVDSAKLLQAITQGLKDNPQNLKQDLLKLFSSDSYKNVLKDVMDRRWLLQPQEVADKEKVKDFYAKLSVDMERLARAAVEVTKSSNLISNNAASLQNNVDFINNVNQAYSYIQLPLKLSGQEASGDLYVFSNKKAKRSPDDEITAFLHFDLKSLGSTDISIKMKNKNVSTDFYLEDDESFGLVEKNLPVLQERLDSLGYNAKLSVKCDTRPMDFVEDFLKQDVAFGGDVRRYSFNVTA